MIFLSSLHLATRAILRNRLRSLLTELGVIIGVAALIVTVASGEGAKAQIAAQIASLGSNLMLVDGKAVSSVGVRLGAGTKALMRDDLLEIIKSASAVRLASPIDRINTQVINGDRNWATSTFGVWAAFFEIRDWTVDRGRFFDDQEVGQGAKVCVLGATVVENLFGSQDPIGEIIRVKQMPCEVIGTLRSKGQSSLGQDQDDLIVMPQPTFKSRMLNEDRNIVHDLILSVQSPQEMTLAMQQVTAILRQKHRIPEGGDDDFRVRNISDMARAREEVIETQTRMLRNVAAVSLLVGGIGIMNIMLVSVTERTREIGLRLAIGASEVQVLLQFLVEAVVLSAMGGVIGIGVGLGGAWATAHFMGWPMLITPSWVALAVGISIGIGVVFGFYPARKAAQLDPIEALRYE
jgi:putative ABC transport system permease protein